MNAAVEQNMDWRPFNTKHGFVIDVSDTRALTEVLKKLDADVARYRAPPPKDSTRVRSAADQGAELAKVYRKICAAERAAHPSRDRD
jgi:hypothetical protein